MLYSPVCGVDSVGEQKTFASECAFNAENCRNPNASKYQIDRLDLIIFRSFNL